MLQSIANKLESQMFQHLNQCGLMFRLFARVKTIGSLHHKMQIKGENYRSGKSLIQDMIGLRIVLYFQDDVDALAFFYSMITVIILWSTIPAFFYACRYSKNESLWSYVYGLFNFFALFWIAPYALITIQKSGWLTRNSQQKKK